MKSRIAIPVVVLAGLLAGQAAQAFPQPSPYPVSWELKFKYAEPKRIVVEVPGEPIPKAYWYLTYTVTNKTDQEINFLPVFEMVTRSGKVIRSDKGIPKVVFDRIKQRTGNQFLEPTVKIAGELRIGEDQAKDGVAIWEEPEAEMGAFSIFVGGLSGESTPLTDSEGKPMNGPNDKPLILFKTLQLDYTVAGDEVYPGIDPVTKTHERWIMR